MIALYSKTMQRAVRAPELARYLVAERLRAEYGRSTALSGVQVVCSASINNVTQIKFTGLARFNRRREQFTAMVEVTMVRPGTSLAEWAGRIVFVQVNGRVAPPVLDRVAVRPTARFSF